jgi:phosphatidylserine/phosphatidylglycerophosphate/cardiolipin synthase-like enzyme
VAGIRVEILGRGEVGDFDSHGKMTLIDDRRAIFGSSSLSRPGLDVRREVGVVIENPAIVKELSDFFERTRAANAGRLGQSGPRPADTDEDDDEG